MKQLLITILFVLSHIFAAASSKDSLLAALDRELEVKDVYVANKLERINALRMKLRKVSPDIEEQYRINAQIFEEYKAFNYDSAFAYANKLMSLAYGHQDEAKVKDAKMKFGFVLLSAGMFKEAVDSLMTIHGTALKKELKPEYYSLMARTFYGLSDFNADTHYSQLYNLKGNTYVDSVLMYSAPQSFEHLYFRGLRHTRMMHLQQGLHDLESLNKQNNLSFHQSAVVFSTLSDIYLKLEQPDKAMALLAAAAIYDIKASIKETAAILVIAELLHKQGDIRKSYDYTKHALADANFYNARHRKIRVGTILPIVEEEKMGIVESQKQSLITYSVLVTALSIAVIGFIFISLKQVSRLKQAQKEIHSTNTKLQYTNNKLMEANKIKEEYIGYYFNINSEYLDKVEKFKKSLDQYLTAKKYDHLSYIVNSINPRKEREELYRSFDSVFLKLFPAFVQTYNTFFKPEDQVVLTDNQLMSTDLRIFALIRIGISDNDKIAKILGYSVNTIYTYKTRIKNKAIIPNDEFEKRIMEIEPV